MEQQPFMVTHHLSDKIGKQDSCSISQMLFLHHVVPGVGGGEGPCQTALTATSDSYHLIPSLSGAQLRCKVEPTQ